MYKNQASIMKASILALFLVMAAEGGRAEQVLLRYELNIDQQVIQPIPVPHSKDDSIIILKKFLENRKSRVDPERSKYINYEIMDLQTSKIIPFVTLGNTALDSIGAISRTNDEFVGSVIRQGQFIELYRYIASRNTVERLGLNDQAVEIPGIKKLFALSKGYLAISSKGSQLSATYQGQNRVPALTLDFKNEASRLVGIDDVLETNGRIYIIVSTVESDKSDISAVWLYNFDPQLAKGNLKKTKLITEPALSHKSAFIYSTHNTPSIQVVSRKSLKEPATLSLFKLDGKPKRTWQYRLLNVEEGDDIAIVGICSDEYIFARRGHSKESTPKEPNVTGIEFRVIEKTGKEGRVWYENMVVNGSLINVKLYPTSHYLFSFTNLTKTEEIRRTDGWYSWLGFRVDKFDIRKECR